VPYEAVTIGRAPSRSDADVVIAQIPQLGGDAASRRERALAELAELAGLRARGLREPLPLPCLTAAAYAEAIVKGGAGPNVAERLARDAWESVWEYPKEDQEPDHVIAFGGQVTMAELTAIEAGAAHFPDYALQLWAPLLARERVLEL
jgi:exodeoxyribonuclease V gamma subunit